jgi:hypothetical protein
MQTWPIAHNTVKHVETGHIWDHLLCAEKTGVQLKLVYKLTKVSCIGTLYLKFIQDYVLFRVQFWHFRSTYIHSSIGDLQFPIFRFLSVPDDGHFRNASCALDLISTILLLSQDRYHCWWLLIPDGYHPPSSQCFGTDMIY